MVQSALGELGPEQEQWPSGEDTCKDGNSISTLTLYQENFSFLRYLPDCPILRSPRMISIVSKLEDMGGYWAIGGLFALCEVAMLYAFSDILGYSAAIVGVVWIFGGMVPRYLLHNWWLHKRKKVVD